jgi:hypothetical protein
MEISEWHHIHCASEQRIKTYVFVEHCHHHPNIIEDTSYNQLVMNKMVENKSMFVSQIEQQLNKQIEIENS